MTPSDINNALFDWLNDGAGRVGALDHLMIWAAKYGIYAIGAIVVLSWFVRTCEPEDRRLAVYTAVLSAVIAVGVAIAIQHAYVHQRPFVVRDDVELLMNHSADASFPSEHASAAFGLAAGAGLYRPRIGVALIAIAALMSIARVFVGIHYPADVAAGAALGIISALAVFVARPALLWLDRMTVVRIAPAMLQ